MAGLDVVVIATLIVLYGAVGMRVERSWLTMPIVFTVLGIALQAVGVVDVDVALPQIAVFAELTLAIVLFSDASRMDVRRLTRDVGLPARLLLVGLPLTVVAGTLLNWWVLDTSIWAGAVIAAAVAPTDAAVGQAIVADDRVPIRIRQALNVESGLNDGMVVPLLVLAVALLVGERRGGGEWASFVLRQAGGGTATGLAVGAIAAGLVRAGLVRRWAGGINAQVGTAALAVALFAIAGELDVNQFIAAFVGGLTFGAVLADDDAEHLAEFTEDAGALMAMVMFFVFGNLFVSAALDAISVRVVVCAALALTIGRILPVWIATFGAGLAAPTRLFLGWYGPRGIASIVFAIILLEEDLPDGGDLVAVITLTVVVSVVAHGLSAVPGAAAYGRWIAAMGKDTADGMAEMAPSIERRLRRVIDRLGR